MDTRSHFNNTQAISNYADNAARLVPGLHDMHKMVAILLAECIPEDGKVLVLGAGGGLEIRALAEAQEQWTFDGVDPSEEMLKLAEVTLKPYAGRVNLHRGYIDIAPDGPFDGATALLTLHFIPSPERLNTLREIHKRLNPGAPLVVVHMSIPQENGEREQWFLRYQAFAVASGIDPDMADKARAGISAQLPILTPEEDESILRSAGFLKVTQFYAASIFRGWVAYA